MFLEKFTQVFFWGSFQKTEAVSFFPTVYLGILLGG